MTGNWTVDYFLVTLGSALQEEGYAAFSQAKLAYDLGVLVLVGKQEDQANQAYLLDIKKGCIYALGAASLKPDTKYVTTAEFCELLPKLVKVCQKDKDSKTKLELLRILI